MDEEEVDNILVESSKSSLTRLANISIRIEPFDVNVAAAFALGFVVIKPSSGDNDSNSSSDSSSSSMLLIFLLMKKRKNQMMTLNHYPLNWVLLQQNLVQRLLQH